MSESYEYISDSSDYVSSVLHDETPLFESRIEDSPFPSLTKSEKSKLNDILHKGKVSTFEHNEYVEVKNDGSPDESLTDKNSCCCLC